MGVLEIVSATPAELVLISTTAVGDSVSSGLLSTLCDVIELGTPSPDTFVIVRLTILGIPSVAKP